MVFDDESDAIELYLGVAKERFANQRRYILIEMVKKTFRSSSFAKRDLKEGIKTSSRVQDALTLISVIF